MSVRGVESACVLSEQLGATDSGRSPLITRHMPRCQEPIRRRHRVNDSHDKAFPVSTVLSLSQRRHMPSPFNRDCGSARREGDDKGDAAEKGSHGDSPCLHPFAGRTPCLAIVLQFPPLSPTPRSSSPSLSHPTPERLQESNNMALRSVPATQASFRQPAGETSTGDDKTFLILINASDDSFSLH